MTSFERGPCFQYLVQKNLLISQRFVSRYRDFRNPPGHPQEYKHNIYYWHVITAKLAFIIVMEVGEVYFEIAYKAVYLQTSS